MTVSLGFPKNKMIFFVGNGRFNGSTSIFQRTLQSSLTSTSIFKESTTEHESHKYGSQRSRQAQDSSPRDQSKYSEVHQHFHAYTSELQRVQQRFLMTYVPYMRPAASPVDICTVHAKKSVVWMYGTQVCLHATWWGGWINLTVQWRHGRRWRLLSTTMTKSQCQAGISNAV